MATNNAINNSFGTLTALTNGATLNDNLSFPLLGFYTSAGTPVNFIEVANANTGNQPFLQGIGSDTNVTLGLLGKGTGGVAIHGTGTNDSASAGYVGEFKDSGLSALSNFTTTNTVQNLQTLSLTAGDWDVTALFTFSSSGATTTATLGSLSLTSATNSPINSTSSFNFTAAALMNVSAYPVARVSIASTTTVYLVGQATFTVGNPQFLAGITARRVR